MIQNLSRRKATAVADPREGWSPPPSLIFRPNFGDRPSPRPVSQCLDPALNGIKKIIII